MSIFGGETLEFATGLDLSGIQGDFRSLITQGNLAANALSAAFSAAWETIGTALRGVTVGAIETGSEFEALQARLSTLLGSAEAGKKRMDEVFAVSASTPFNVDELVEAEAILESFGANAPVWRTAVMDLSAAMGFDLAEAASAVGRGFSQGAGAADLLRERGVIAMVELEQGVKATSLSTNEFRDALYDTLTDPDGKIAGGTARLSKTFAGLVSNLEDEWTGFQKGISDAGFFEGAKTALRETLALIDANRGAAEQLSDEIGTGLTAALAFAIRTLGGMVDAWTLVKAAVVGGNQLLFAWEETILRITARAMDLGNTISAAAGGPAIFEGSLEAVRAKLVEVQDAGFAAADEAKRLSDSFGDGYTAAKKISDAILDGARSTEAAATGAGQLTGELGAAAIEAQKLGKARHDIEALTQAFNDLTAKTAAMGQTGMEAVLADQAAALAELDAITRDRLLASQDNYAMVEEILIQHEMAKLDITAAYARQAADIQTAEAQKAADAEQAIRDQQARMITGHYSSLLGSFGDFVTARIEGEESLGKSLLKMIAHFLAQELLLLASQLSAKGAALIATGVGAPLGALYLAGAAAAVAGAATLEAGAAGAFSSGSSSSSSGTTTTTTGDSTTSGTTSGEEAGQTTSSSSSSSRSSSGGSQPIYLRWKHEVFDVTAAESLQIPGSALSNALRDPNAGVRAR